MAATASQVVSIIADDLTGACDTGCLFAGPGPVGVLAAPALTAADSSVITVDTESRSLPPRDPAFRAATSDVADLLAGGAPVVPLGLDDVRAGAEKVAHLLEHHRGALVAADAETDADLATLAEAALLAPGTLIAGSAGLGRALSRALGCGAPAVALPPGRARLVVVGSRHPASRAQLDALLAAGVPLV